MIRIAPSVLAADFARLGDQIAEAEAGGADWIHVDVMDGVFVPDLTFGPKVVAACRRVTGLPLDVHLMMKRPSAWLEAFADAGADGITVHAEVEPHLHRTLTRIRDLGVRPGLAVNPLTPLEVVREARTLVDLVLVMSVNPGFGGQRWIEGSEERIRTARRLLDEAGSEALVEVDGGVDARTAGLAARAGADVLVAGSAVFGEGDVGDNVRALRDAAGAGAA